MSGICPAKVEKVFCFWFFKDGQMVKAAVLFCLSFQGFVVASIGGPSYNAEVWGFATDRLFHGLMDTTGLHMA